MSRRKGHGFGEIQLERHVHLSAYVDYSKRQVTFTLKQDFQANKVVKASFRKDGRFATRVSGLGLSGLVSPDYVDFRRLKVRSKPIEEPATAPKRTRYFPKSRIALY